MRRQIPLRSLALIMLLGTTLIAPTVAHDIPGDLGVAPERLVFARTGVDVTTGGILAASSLTGDVAATLPLGVADRQWSVLYATAALGPTTVVTAYNPRTGTALRETTVDGSWALPVVIDGGQPEGLSFNGRKLILFDQAPEAGSSRFAMLDTSFSEPPEVVTLRGAFAYDATSPNGDAVYLVKHLSNGDPGHYEVRVYDMVTNWMAPDPIVDKRELDELMQGRPVARATSSDGTWVNTLYVKEDGTAFVHQLDTVDRFALCADLPAMAQATDPAQAAAWRLVLHNPMAPYAANGALGVVISVDSGTAPMTGELPAATAGGPADDLELAISPDGTMLYAAGADGLTTLSSARLAAVGQAVRTPPLAGIEAAPDGWLYGLDRGGDILTLGVAEGQPSAAELARVALRPAQSTTPMELLGSIPFGSDTAQQ
jgi:hypothetical protein